MNVQRLMNALKNIVEEISKQRCYTPEFEHLAPAICEAHEAIKEAEKVNENDVIATRLTADPYDEREGIWFSMKDIKRMMECPTGTHFYMHPDTFRKAVCSALGEHIDTEDDRIVVSILALRTQCRGAPRDTK